MENHILQADIRTKNGKIKHIEQTFVPTSKTIEYLELSPEKYPDLSQGEWIKKDAEFIASLFTETKVTAKELIDGMDVFEFNEFLGTVGNQLLGVDPKKLVEEPLVEVKQESESTD